MKYDAPSLICRAADHLRRKDGGAAYALYELAGNLQQLMAGKVTLEEWNSVYTDSGSRIDADERMP